MKRRTRSIAILGLAAVLTFGAAACGSDDDGGEDTAATTTAADGSGTDDGGEAEEVALPDGWPAELALPEGTTVIQAAETSDTTLTVVARIDGDVEDVFDALKAQLTEAGYEIVGSTFTADGEGGYGSISAKNDQYTVAIAFGPDATGATNQVTINLAVLA